MTMTRAYQEAAALAETNQQPAVVFVDTRHGATEYRAMLAADYADRPAAGYYFDTVSPEED